ncbi:hypothetical protein ACNOYE_30190 [Nannocystaceae bacterium ST9]
MEKQEILRFHDGNATLVVDARYFPLTIYTWFGAATMSLVDEYFKARWQFDARAQAAKTKVIIVTDLSAFGAPPATIRKALAERAKDTDKSDALHCYVTCVPNSLLRGVVTALQWIAGDQAKQNTNLASMMLTLRFALNEYEKLGITVPNVDPASYAAPEPNG